MDKCEVSFESCKLIAVDGSEPDSSFILGIFNQWTLTKSEFRPIPLGMWINSVSVRCDLTKCTEPKTMESNQRLEILIVVVQEAEGMKKLNVVFTMAVSCFQQKWQNYFFSHLTSKKELQKV